MKSPVGVLRPACGSLADQHRRDVPAFSSFACNALACVGFGNSVHHRHGSGRLSREIHMKAILAKLVRDEQGGEVLEYALIMGLIVVACIAVIGTVGGKVLAKWNSVNTSM